MSNYIFVDIDCPLLPTKLHLLKENRKITRSKLYEAQPVFDEFAVRCFNLWTKYADAKIIFSTNWASAPGIDADHLKMIMEMNGLKFKGQYHNEILTPKKFTSQRGSEIWWWLIDNAKDDDKFIAVDDDTSCYYVDSYISDAKEKGYVKVKDFTGKWIEVDSTDGLSYRNFLDGCEALGINLEDIDEGEFGIKPLTAEEKEKREKALDLLIQCMV